MSLVYLAAPYSDKDKAVVEARMVLFCKVDAELSRKGIFTVSPLLKHLVLQHSILPSDWEYWRDYSISLLTKCDYMIVIMMDGWKESVGVQDEIKLCNLFDVPIKYINPEDILVDRK